jgi:hypothetical protein
MMLRPRPSGRGGLPKRDVAASATPRRGSERCIFGCNCLSFLLHQPGWHFRGNGTALPRTDHGRIMDGSWSLRGTSTVLAWTDDGPCTDAPGSFHGRMTVLARSLSGPVMASRQPPQPMPAARRRLLPRPSAPRCRRRVCQDRRGYHPTTCHSGQPRFFNHAVSTAAFNVCSANLTNSAH